MPMAGSNRPAGPVRRTGLQHEIVRLVIDPAVWAQTGLEVAPTLWPQLVGRGVTDCSIINAWADLDWVETLQVLFDVIGRLPDFEESQEWDALLKASNFPAMSKKRRTLEALNNPASNLVGAPREQCGGHGGKTGLGAPTSPR